MKLNYKKYIVAPTILIGSISNIFILPVILSLFFSLKNLTRNFYFFLLFISLVLIKIILDWRLINFNNLGWLSELKILYSLLLMSFIFFKTYPWLIFFKNRNQLIDSFLIFSLIFMLTSLINGGILFRFVDNFPFDLQYISIYYGISVFILIAISSGYRFYLLCILLLINGSGSAIAGGSLIIIYKFLKFDISVVKKITLTIFGFAIIFSAFIAGQNSRERDLADFENIDRYVLTSAGIEYILNDFELKDHLIGKSFNTEIQAGRYMNSAIRDYLYAENNRKIFPRNFHNDYLRIYTQYGIIGFFLFAMSIWSFFKKNKIIILGIMVSAIANSLIFISPIIFLLALAGNLDE